MTQAAATEMPLYAKLLPNSPPVITERALPALHALGPRSHHHTAAQKIQRQPHTALFQKMPMRLRVASLPSGNQFFSFQA